MNVNIVPLNVLAIFFAFLGAWVSATNIQHARNDLSPLEPHTKTKWHVLALIAFVLSGLGAIAFEIFGPRWVPDQWCIAYFVALLALALPAVDLLYRALDNGRAYRRRCRRLTQAVALGLIGVLTLTGCSFNKDTGKAQIDLSAIPDNVHLLTQLVEDYAVIVLPPGREQDSVIQQAEKARALSSVPSLNILLANLQKAGAARGLPPATQPVQ